MLEVSTILLINYAEHFTRERFSFYDGIDGIFNSYIYYFMLLRFFCFLSGKSHNNLDDLRFDDPGGHNLFGTVGSSKNLFDICIIVIAI